MASGDAATDVELCGWRVRTEVPLPGIPPWLGPDGPADIVISMGSVPQALVDSVRTTPFAELGQDGTILVRIDAVARYLVLGSREVIVEPADGASPGDVRLFLLGSVLGLLCHLRGCLPLHASSLSIGGRAVALLGHSGEGKSTAAAALSAAGHGLLSDDIAPLDPDGSRIRVRPTFPTINLWANSVAAVGLEKDALEAARTNQGKYKLQRPQDFAGKPVPLAALYELRSDPRCVRLSIEPIRGADAVSTLYPHIYRRRLGELATGRAPMFGAVVRVLREVPMFAITRRRDLAELDMLVEALEAHVAGLP